MTFFDSCCAREIIPKLDYVDIQGTNNENR